MDKREDDGYRFVKEQIKKKPVDKKEFGIRLGRAAVFGVVFGVLAALSFGIARPVFEDLFAGEEEKVDLPDDSSASVSAEPEPEPEPVYITETQQMELADYQVLQNKLYGVGKEANKSVVAVTSVRSARDWFDSDYETQGQGAGVIIADTDQKYMVVTERKLIEDAKHIRVSFIDNTTADAELAAYDRNTGIAVLSVEKDAVDAKTRKQIRVAELGSSGMVSQGTMVIAVGSPLGEVYSILTGSVTSVGNQITTADANYRVITTDIIGTQNGSGALVNLDGRILGLIMQDYGTEDNQNTVTAIGISELRDLIEGLSNGRQPVYLGLEISAVTDEIAGEYDLPEGLYVRNVRMDSPAMEAGIQIGDIIVEMNGSDMLTEDQYEGFLKGARTGQEVTVTVRRMGADNQYQDVECTAVLGTLK